MTLAFFLRGGMKMSVQEVIEKYNIKENELKEYIEKGYIVKSNGEYSDHDFRHISLIRTLLKTGIKEKELCLYLKFLDMQGMEEERIKILRGRRVKLLDEIHLQQQILDHIDYFIYEIQQGKQK